MGRNAADPIERSEVREQIDLEVGSALSLAAAFGLCTFVFHLLANLYQAHLGYGYFRDELYYILCGRHLAWGYVDQGPLVAVQARLAESVFGHSLVGLRLLSGLAGAGRVFLTGMLAWSLGGRRPAQALGMLGVSLVPAYLALDGVLSMNSFESLFWMTCLLSMVLILRGGSSQLWLVFGASAGLGLLNKPSMTFFLVALLLALLVTPQRRVLFNLWALAGVLLLLVLVFPNLLWQAHFHWPTLEFLRNGELEHKNKVLSPLTFIVGQIVTLNPLSLLIWGAGLVWLMRREAWRWLGLGFLFFLAIMMALHAKDYYVLPIYPILFAAGGIAWEERFGRSRPVLRGQWFAFPGYETALILSALLVLPMSTPMLRPASWIVYAKTLHLYGSSGNSENEASGLLPQFYADRFGWQEEVDSVQKIVASLTPEDRSQVAILCSNYGEASALLFLGHQLPPVISGHNNYFLWGPGGASGEVLILISGGTPDEIRQFYEGVEIAGHLGSTYSMPYEHRNIYLVRHRKKNLTLDWINLKHYI